MVMKSLIRSSMVAGFALTGFCGAAKVDPTVIDNFYLKPTAATAAYSSLMDQQGNFFVAGSAYTDSNVCHWVVRKSSDGGATWKTTDDYQYAPGVASYDDIDPVLGQDLKGNLYGAGYSFDKAGNIHWIVRKSTDGGETWSTVDDYRNTGSVALATGFASDANGNLYTAGYATTKNSGYHWIVRKSSNGGASWSVVDDFQFSSGAVAEPSSIVVDGNGNIYCAGSASNRYVVRKSSDAGLTWTTVDNYQGQGGVSTALAILVDSNNYIYSAGTAYGPTVTTPNSVQGSSTWIVRKSVDGGQTWENVDSFQLAAAKLSQANGLSTDSDGNIYATGYGQDANGYQWVTRKSADQGATWSTIDTYQLSKGKMAMAKTVFTDADNNVYISGKASSRWIVRKLASQ